MIRRVPLEWQKLNAEIGQLANKLSRRIDLSAYIGEGAGRGQAAALYDPVSMEIEISTPFAFGPGVRPDMVGDFSLRDTHFDWPVAAGSILHEAMHAQYTTLAMCSSFEVLDPDSNHWMDMLDEPRIEGLGVRQYPENREFLRACALGIVFKDTSDKSLAEVTRTAAAAQLAVLALGRVDAHVLNQTDVTKIRAKVMEIIPREVFVKLRALWREFLDLRGETDLQRMFDISREFAAIVNEQSAANDDPEPSEDDLQDLLDALLGDRISTEFAASDAVFRVKVKEETVREEKRRADTAEDESKSKGQAKETFQRSVGPNGTTSRSTLVNRRPPTPEERAVANKIAEAMKKARYRERRVTLRNSATPPGRLNAGIAMQATAVRKHGGSIAVEPWREKRHHHVEDPNLTVGIMCDISGSMGQAMEPIAVSAWVMSAAVQKIHGRAAAVYYGNDTFAVLKPGEFLKEVTVYSAADGSEAFDKGFRALDGGLDLLKGTGARLLVICSDGQYRPTEAPNCIKWLTACREAGVAVLWLDYKNSSLVQSIAKETGAHVVIVGKDVVSAANAIGAACTEALTRASR